MTISAQLVVVLFLSKKQIFFEKGKTMMGTQLVIIFSTRGHKDKKKDDKKCIVAHCLFFLQKNFLEKKNDKLYFLCKGTQTHKKG